MMVMMVMAAGRLSQILDVGELAAGRGVREVRSKLVELARCCRIAVRLRRLRSAFEIRGDLLGNLLILGRVRLLELLERAQQLRERGKLLCVRLRRANAARTVRGDAGGRAGALKRAENRL